MLIIKFLTGIQIIFVANTAAQVNFPGKHAGNTKIFEPGQKNVRKNSKNPADILYEKCLEYGKARYETVKIPAATIIDEDEIKEVLNCVLSEPQIVGGVPAWPKEFPHMALLGYPFSSNNVQWSCGGSLISDRYVLTAAHCRYLGNQIEVKWVRLGELELNSEKDDARPKDFSIIEFYTYPQYKKPQVYHDIMLLKLSETVKFSPYIRPICLYNRTDLPHKFENESIVTGWGRTAAGETESDELRKTKVNLVQKEECYKSYPPDGNKYPTGLKSQFMICAGDKGNDTCQGDSGGPLQALIPDMDCMYYQFGITSMGDLFCGAKGKPAIYTRVAPYIPWIQSIVWP